MNDELFKNLPENLLGDRDTNKIYYEGVQLTKSAVINQSFFQELLKTDEKLTPNQLYEDLRVYLMFNKYFSSKELKEAEKAQKQKEKEEQKRLEKEAKEAEKEAKKKLKEFEKEQKEQEEKEKALERLKQIQDLGYVTTDTGQMLNLVVNYESALKEKEWTSLFDYTYNTFNGDIYYNGNKMTNYHISELQHYTGIKLHLDDKKRLLPALELVAHEKEFNPIHDFYNSGVWDGISRMETLFIKYFGVEDTPLNRALTKKWFIGLVKRAFEPGCHFDNILILIDPKQGTGKSTIFERLANVISPPSKGESLFYKFDKNIDAHNKDIELALSVSYIVCFDEMAALNKADTDFVKSFVSTTIAKLRRPYKEMTETFFRHIACCGTTNQLRFLKDTSIMEDEAERRFWTLLCNGEVHTKAWWDENLPDEYLIQILFEAYQFYKENPDFDPNVLTPEENAQLALVQDQHKTSNDDIAIDRVCDILNIGYNHVIDYTTSAAFITKEFKDMQMQPNYGVFPLSSITPKTLITVLDNVYKDKRTAKWASTQLKKLGWIQSDTQKRVNGVTTYIYKNPNDATNIEVFE